jgi:HD-GYP domain-containing protein (c-di-GMP phosphodiesterase class II)
MKNQKPTIQRHFISQSGSNLVLKLYNAIRSLTNVEHDISTLHEQVEEMIKKQGEFAIHVGKDRLLLNDHRIEMRSGHLVHHALLSELKKRNISRVEFSEVPDGQHLETFLRCLMQTKGDGQDGGETLQKSLAEKSIESIVVEGFGQPPDSEDRRSDKERNTHDARIYFYAIALMREIFGRARRQESLDLGLARKVTRTITSWYGNAPTTFMALATFKSNRDILANHAVNVAIYAIALGHRLGFSNRFLVDLGLAALLHDIGESRLSWLKAGGKRRLTESEWAEAMRHPVEGVRILTGVTGVKGHTMNCLLAGAFEHHLGYDLSGFPSLKRKRGLSLVGGIVALADFYDRAARPYGKNMFPFFSDRLPEAIMERSGTDFDPILARYFVRSIGILPVGTMCLLDTGEVGIVTRPMEEDTTGERPWVRLLEQDGSRYQPGESVDLNSTDPRTGGYNRTIVEILDPNDLNIDVAEYLIDFESDAPVA